MDDRNAQRDLGAFGTLQMTSLADPATGAVRYWLTAPHVRGSVVLIPALLFADPTDTHEPDHDLYLFPRLDGLGVAGRHERPLSVHGIALTSRSAVNTRDLRTIEAYRTGREGRPVPLRGHSRLLARAALGAAAAHWRQRSDRSTLDALAVQSSAQHFLNLSQHELADRKRALQRAQRALAETQQRIDMLREITGDAAPDDSPA
ncbi:hypothetical protein ACIG3E_33665 [Streptomyces sp. NPDC053474]|uniref:hypothetical protein n=1 Tax=Streptomyces sp. NPDC053474 TaxID=3365704 RepID=UPI0037D161B9